MGRYGCNEVVRRVLIGGKDGGVVQSLWLLLMNTYKLLGVSAERFWQGEQLADV